MLCGIQLWPYECGLFEPLYQQVVPSLSFTIGLQTEPDVDAQEMAVALGAFRKLARTGWRRHTSNPEEAPDEQHSFISLGVQSRD